ncbi:MAG: Coq4 family protein [Rhodobiaceae bacterium]|nr:Coq4 family protein [Rhodobiaceae bacterium]
MSDSQLRKRIRPIVALKATRAILKDKEDTAQVFRIVDALSGSSYYKTFKQFAASSGGQDILRRRLDLLDPLRDREALARLPTGSLGRAYLDFVYGEGLSADGLVEASEEGSQQRFQNEDAELFRNRMRDSHDLWHVVTGYGRDGLGEICVLSFGNGQMYNRGIAYIVLIGILKTRREQPQLPVWRAAFEAWRRGRKAGWFPAVAWEDWLVLPLAEVRERLGLDEPPIYRGVEAESKRLEAEFQAHHAGAGDHLPA